MKTILNKVTALIVIFTFSLTSVPTAFSAPAQQQDKEMEIPAVSPLKAANEDIRNHLHAPVPTKAPDLNVNPLERVAHAPGDAIGIALGEAKIISPAKPAFQIIAIKLPAPIQDYVKGLQEKVGIGFKVSAALQKDGSYLVSVTDTKIYTIAPTSGLHQMSFTLSKEGKMNTASIQAAYYSPNGIIKTNSNMLFQAMKLLNPDSTDDKNALARMSKIAVHTVDADGSIHFRNDNGAYYKVSRNADGRVTLTRELSPAVQKQVEDLQRTLGLGYVVQAVHSETNPDQYVIKVSLKDSANIQTGNFVSMKYTVNSNGEYIAGSANANYKGFPWSATLKYDLLFEGAKLIAGGNTIQAAEAMTKMTMKSVESNGTIHFAYKNIQLFKVSRDPAGVVKIEREVPPAVKAFMDQLQAQIGSGFLVRVLFPDDGTYRVIATDIKSYMVIPSSGFRNFSLTVSPNGAVLAVASASYYFPGGLKKVDGALLFEALHQLPQIPEGMDMRALVNMTKLAVIQVDADGAIHFQLSERFWKASRGADGKAMFERDLTPAVAKFMSDLRASLDGFIRMNITPQDDGTFKVEVTSAGYGFMKMTFSLNANAEIQSAGFTASYNHPANVDGKLLFDAVKLLNPGISNIQALKMMTSIPRASVDENGIMHFQLVLGGQFFKAFRDANGNIKVEKEFPPAVEGFLIRARLLMGEGFSVTAEFDEDGYYRVSIKDTKNYLVAPTSGLHQINFTLSLDSQLNRNSLDISYYGPNGDVVLRGNLLFDAVESLFNSESCNADHSVCTTRQISVQGVFVKLSKLTIERVDTDGAIHFVLDGQNFKAFRGADGNVKVEKELSLAEVAIDELAKQLAANGLEATIEKKPDGSYVLNVHKIQPLVAMRGQFDHINVVLRFVDGTLKADSMESFYQTASTDKEILNGLIFLQLPNITLANAMIILSNKLYHLEIANDQFTTIISLGNKQFKIIQQNGTATISEMNIRDFPHINEAASHFGIAVENIVGLNKYEGLAVCRSLSCPSWALYVEIRALINGQEVLLSGTVLGKPLSPNR